ncbi:MAG: hypothetical protein M1834_005996 [Cirrosporium novae-zelandiae]|nr:MAG: hypothetical protein M1834_005996 [Cirrosporium novae-zelandiae]
MKVSTFNLFTAMALVFMAAIASSNYTTVPTTLETVICTTQKQPTAGYSIPNCNIVNDVVTEFTITERAIAEDTIPESPNSQSGPNITLVALSDNSTVSFTGGRKPKTTGHPKPGLLQNSWIEPMCLEEGARSPFRFLCPSYLARGFRWEEHLELVKSRIPDTARYSNGDAIYCENWWHPLIMCPNTGAPVWLNHNLCLFLDGTGNRRFSGTEIKDALEIVMYYDCQVCSVNKIAQGGWLVIDFLG